MKVAGSPYEMGFQHGQILRKQIEKAREVMKHLVKKYYKTSLTEYVSKCVSFVKETDEWKNIFDELRGICDGCSSTMSLNELIAWNMYLSMDEIYGRITGLNTGSVASSVASLDESGIAALPMELLLAPTSSRTVAMMNGSPLTLNCAVSRRNCSPVTAGSSRLVMAK